MAAHAMEHVPHTSPVGNLKLLSLGGSLERALEMVTNTAPFDVSHHPAMAVPCGMSDGLPISMMLVGKHFDEATIYRAAYAFEQAADWKKL